MTIAGMLFFFSHMICATINDVEEHIEEHVDDNDIQCEHLRLQDKKQKETICHL